jgi:hypothetical protein
MITTLVVKPVNRKSETSGFGAGIDWKRYKDGARYMNHPLSATG